MCWSLIREWDSMERDGVRRIGSKRVGGQEWRMELRGGQWKGEERGGLTATRWELRRRRNIPETADCTIGGWSGPVAWGSSPAMSEYSEVLLGSLLHPTRVIPPSPALASSPTPCRAQAVSRLHHQRNTPTRLTCLRTARLHPLRILATETSDLALGWAMRMGLADRRALRRIGVYGENTRDSFERLGGVGVLQERPTSQAQASLPGIRLQHPQHNTRKTTYLRQGRLTSSLFSTRSIVPSRSRTYSTEGCQRFTRFRFGCPSHAGYFKVGRWEHRVGNARREPEAAEFEQTQGRYGQTGQDSGHLMGEYDSSRELSRTRANGKGEVESQYAELGEVVLYRSGVGAVVRLTSGNGAGMVEGTRPAMSIKGMAEHSPGDSVVHMYGKRSSNPNAGNLSLSAGGFSFPSAMLFSRYSRTSRNGDSWAKTGRRSRATWAANPEVASVGMASATKIKKIGHTASETEGWSRQGTGRETTIVTQANGAQLDDGRKANDPDMCIKLEEASLKVEEVKMGLGLYLPAPIHLPPQCRRKLSHEQTITRNPLHRHRISSTLSRSGETTRPVSYRRERKCAIAEDIRGDEFKSSVTVKYHWLSESSWVDAEGDQEDEEELESDDSQEAGGLCLGVEDKALFCYPGLNSNNIVADKKYHPRRPSVPSSHALSAHA
ncbi:hypothetical protein BDV93DRAFT_545769 [Ceratobasidium sp. AG-I]|nr:hypothetical protein BDV93DRAFT_545769 [Ceratobasidium sp. AG-I]